MVTLSSIFRWKNSLFHLDNVLLIPHLVYVTCTLGEIPAQILYLSGHDVATLGRKPPMKHGLGCTYTRLAFASMTTTTPLSTPSRGASTLTP